MTTPTLIEQLNKSPKWTQFEKWYKEQYYEIPLYDNHPSLFGFIELEFDFQKSIFEKFIQSCGYWVATHDYSDQVSLIKDNEKYSEFDGTFEELLIYYFNLPSAYYDEI